VAIVVEHLCGHDDDQRRRRRRRRRFSYLNNSVYRLSPIGALHLYLHHHTHGYTDTKTEERNWFSYSYSYSYFVFRFPHRLFSGTVSIYLCHTNRTRIRVRIYMCVYIVFEEREVERYVQLQQVKQPHSTRKISKQAKRMQKGERRPKTKPNHREPDGQVLGMLWYGMAMVWVCFWFWICFCFSYIIVLYFFLPATALIFSFCADFFFSSFWF